jgi:hypothetical protein
MTLFLQEEPQPRLQTDWILAAFGKRKQKAKKATNNLYQEAKVKPAPRSGY